MARPQPGKAEQGSEQEQRRRLHVRVSPIQRLSPAGARASPKSGSARYPSIGCAALPSGAPSIACSGCSPCSLPDCRGSRWCFCGVRSPLHSCWITAAPAGAFRLDTRRRDRCFRWLCVRDILTPIVALLGLVLHGLICFGLGIGSAADGHRCRPRCDGAGPARPRCVFSRLLPLRASRRRTSLRPDSRVSVSAPH